VELLLDLLESLLEQISDEGADPQLAAAQLEVEFL
jgi:hypothetical protein